MGTSTTFSQQQRLLTIRTPLGDDRVLLRSFSGQEGISQLFHFRLDLLSEDGSIDFDDIVGQNVTWSARLTDGETERYFNGYVSRFAQLPDEGRLAHYEAEVVPWLWFLTRTADCRIYQNQTVPDVIEDVFNRFSFQDFDNQLSGSYRQREYCVQYRETAFNFVSRLIEQEGIFYFFRHEEGRHTLVLGDAASVHQACPDQETARYEPASGEGFQRQEDYVTEWRIEQELRPGRYASADYNFETPLTRLSASVQSNIDQGGNRSYEIYDYPGEYVNRDESDAEARVRMEQEETPHAVISGAGTCRAFTAGTRFELQDHPRRDQNAAYVLTSVTHWAREGGFYTGVGGEEPAAYQNAFTAIPREVVFRPPLLARNPLVQGSQTAFVVGPSGEEIYCDKYGRVKVQFHWDRQGQRNEESSCWIRVAQSWAGNKWGSMWIPRIGQEVIVDFLEGDPDRPIITGCVYNAASMPPYGLPDEQTKSTFKSNSSKGGGGFNEIRFEDKKGKEQVFIHAQKRMDTRVRGNSYETVGGDRNVFVWKDKLEGTVGDRWEQVNGLHHELIQGPVYEFGNAERMDAARGDFIHYTHEGGFFVDAESDVTIASRSGVLALQGLGGFIEISDCGIVIQGDNVLINCGLSPWGSSSQMFSPDLKVVQQADSGRAGRASRQPSRSRSTSEEDETASTESSDSTEASDAEQTDREDASGPEEELPEEEMEEGEEGDDTEAEQEDEDYESTSGWGRSTDEYQRQQEELREEERNAPQPGEPGYEEYHEEVRQWNLEHADDEPEDYPDDDYESPSGWGRATDEYLEQQRAGTSGSGGPSSSALNQGAQDGSAFAEP